MLTMTEAVERILTDVPLMRTESLGLLEASGRIAATDVLASVAVPPWDNAAMDGYAVRAADAVQGASLSLLGVIGAGSDKGVVVGPGQAVAIMTGAPLPKGADTVVMIENTDGATEGEVRFEQGATLGRHIRRMGSDIPAGSVVVRAGQRLTPARIGLLAAVGLSQAEVRCRPRIAVIGTGDEIVRPGAPLGPGQIYSSNPYALVSLLRELGADADDLGDAPDTLEGLLGCLEPALAYDAIVTTGGVSVGRFDFVKEAFARLGSERGFWKVRMKPGKPLAYGVVHREGHTTALFGLPGNPVSCLVNAHQFVGPWLRTALGMERRFLGQVAARMLEPMKERTGRAKLLRVTLERTPDGFGARPTGSQSSGVLSSMGRAHGLLMLSSKDAGVELGDTVRVQVIEPGFLLAEHPSYPD